MAKAPIVDVTESRSTRQEDVGLQFQRLQRVRARQRSRRRRRLILVAPLAVVLAALGVVAFAAALGASLERLVDARTPVRARTTARPEFSTIGTPVTPALVPDAAGPPRLPVDAPPPVVARHSARRSTPQAAAPHAGATDHGSPPALAGRPDDGAAARMHDEQRDAEAPDPTTAIDWLLHRSRTRAR